MPAISVLLPIRNAQATLDSCLESLASQTFADFEILALNHASSDATADILARWALKEPRLRLLESAAPSLPLALNEGLAQAQGRYVARMDADDLCLPARLERQWKLMESRPELALSSVQVEMFGEGEVSGGYQDYITWVNGLCQPKDIAREIFIECPLPHPTWMARRALFEKLGGYRDDNLPEDYGFVLRAAESGAKMAKVPEPLLKWRDHAGRHSRSHPRYGRQAFMRLRARHLKSMVIRKFPCVLWGAGDRGRLLARYLREEGAEIEFVVGLSSGQNPPSSVHGIPVLLPEQVPAALPGPMVACVGAPGAREEIRKWCGGRKMVEGEDYWFAS